MVEPAWWWPAAPAAVALAWFVRRCRAANHTDWGAAWINYLDGFNRIFCRRFHRLRHETLPLPETGAVLLVSNHVSGLDPLLLIAACRRPLRFVIAREEYERKGLTWLFRAIGCIPVERDSSPRAALTAARQALADGEVVALFPHGRIHLDHEPRCALKRGVAWLAEATHVPVFPVRIDGVRGQGLTLAAVFLPSRTRLRCFSPLYLQDHGPAAFLEQLQQLLAKAAE